MMMMMTMKLEDGAQQDPPVMDDMKQQGRLMSVPSSDASFISRDKNALFTCGCEKTLSRHLFFVDET